MEQVLVPSGPSQASEADLERCGLGFGPVAVGLASWRSLQALSCSRTSLSKTAWLRLGSSRWFGWVSFPFSTRWSGGFYPFLRGLLDFQRTSTITNLSDIGVTVSALLDRAKYIRFCVDCLALNPSWLVRVGAIPVPPFLRAQTQGAHKTTRGGSLRLRYHGLDREGA